MADCLLKRFAMGIKRIFVLVANASSEQCSSIAEAGKTSTKVCLLKSPHSWPVPSMRSGSCVTSPHTGTGQRLDATWKSN